MRGNHLARLARIDAAGLMFPTFLCDLSLAAPVTLSLIHPYGFVSDSTSRSDFVFGSMTMNLADLSP